jgi:hypothetical protein
MRRQRTVICNTPEDLMTHFASLGRPTRQSTGKNYIGVDNGVSGSIGIIPANGVNPRFYLTPTFSSQNYTKAKGNITRIDAVKLQAILQGIPNPFAVLERPMVNPGRFKATTSALRALEATLIVFEMCDIPYLYLDSKEWQKVLLPKGIKSSEELKKASLDIANRLFPQFSKLYKGDGDGILMAEFARRMNL